MAGDWIKDSPKLVSTNASMTTATKRLEVVELKASVGDKCCFWERGG